MQVFGILAPERRAALAAIVERSQGLVVERRLASRSSTPFPSSNDLERSLVSLLAEQGFEHHHNVAHPRTGGRFEYDFFNASLGVAIEVMGYRADDEVFKDVLKFHVDAATRVGVVWVPRWKWISGARSDANFRATTKALAFAEHRLDLNRVA